MTSRYLLLKILLAGLVLFATLIVSVAVMPSSAQAAIITIDPGSHAEGTDLSNISPFVTLQNQGGSFGSSPMTAVRSGFSGGLGFGTHQLGWTGCDGTYGCAQGFGLAFHQSPHWVSLSVTFTNIVLSDIASIGWFAFDAAGDLLTMEFVDTRGYQPGQFYALNIVVPEMMSLVVGGADYPSAGDFDRLSFSVGVPEPSSVVLFALGGIGVFFRRWRRVSANN